MRVLYFLDPGIDLGNPTFRYATLRNSVLPQLESLTRNGHEVALVLGDAVADAALRDGHLRGSFHVAAIDSLEWMGDESGASRSVRFQERNFDDGEIDRLEEILTSHLAQGFQPDLILVWESPASWLTQLFPEARVLYQMPGFFSRPPFPNLVSHDVGLLAESSKQEILTVKDELSAFDNMRDQDRSLLNRSSPVQEYLEKVRRTHSQIVLFPLQIDGYFMIDAVLGPRQHQLEFLVEAISKCPTSIACWITNYRSKDVQSSVLTTKNTQYLRARFPNFFYFEDLDTVPNVSQFLTPEIDGVVTISSSIGFQAAYWKKPLFAPSGSHITAFNSSNSLPEFYEDVIQGRAIDRDELILSLIGTRHPPLSFLASDEYSNWLSTYEKTGTFVPWTRRLVHDLNEERRESDLIPKSGTLIKEEHHHSSKLSQALAHAEVVSFDIFDTLLVRPFVAPADLFDFLEPLVRKQIQRPSLSFRFERQAAEKRAFKAAIERGEEETTLAAIYDELRRAIDISQAQALALARLEMQYERDLLYPRKIGFNAFQEALSLGRRVIVVSDMYLPEAFLADVLEKNGLSGYEKLFVSSRYGVKKQRGKLFDVALNQLGVPPGSVLHIGDNPKGDIEASKSRGMQSFYLAKPTETFMNSDAYRRVWRRDASRHNLNWRMVLAVFANRLFDNPYQPERKGTLFGGDAWKLGYWGLGPLLLGYVKWLLESAKRDGVEHLFFLARDGKIMFDAYNRISALYDGAPKATYLLCSRRAVNLAKARSEADLVDLLYVDFAHLTTLAHLLAHRFGCERTDISTEEIQETGLRWDTRLTKEHLPQLSRLIRAISPKLLEIAERERQSYLRYLEEIGLRNAKRAAVVDIGYAGTMQESLTRIMNHSVPLAGYYLMTFRAAKERTQQEGLSSRAFLAQFVDRHDTYHPFCRHIPLYETLFSSSDSSFIRMETDWNDELRPVFGPLPPHESTRVLLVEKTHQGALDLIDDMALTLGSHLKKIDLEPNKCLRTLDVFFREPHARDAKLFAGIPFEDAYGGKNSHIVPPLNRLKSDGIWSQGRAILIKDALEQQPTPGNKKRTGKAASPLQDDRVQSTQPSRLIGWGFKRFLNGKKLAKFENRPDQFFRDSRYAIIRGLGKRYLREPEQ